MTVMTVCETCGDEGFSQLLFYCSQCQISAVHRYCMDGPPTIDEEDISWYCEKCVPRVPDPPETSQERDQQQKGVSSVDQRDNEVPFCGQQDNGVPFGDQQDNRVPFSDQRYNWVPSSDYQHENGVSSSDQQENWFSPSDQEENRVPLSDQQENCNEKITQHKQVQGYLNTTASGISQIKDISFPLQHGNSKPLVLALEILDPCDKTTYCEWGTCKRGRPRKLKRDLLSGKTVKKKMRTKRARYRRRENNMVFTIADSVVPKDINVDYEQVKPENDMVFAIADSVIPKDIDVEYEQVKPGNNMVSALADSVIRKDINVEDEQVNDMVFTIASSVIPKDINAKDEQVKPENNVVLTIADSVISKDIKHERHSDEVDSKEANKHSDYGEQEPEVTVHDDNNGEDVESCCTIRKSCSPRKENRLVNEMEFSDDGVDDTDNAMIVVSPLKLSNDCELGSDHYGSTMKVVDSNLTPDASLSLGACVPYLPCSSQMVDYVPSQPVIDVIWRGGCVISNNIDPTSFELKAHVSNKASPVVYGAAIALPKIIDFEILSKRYAWPKSFQKSPPTGDIIGLYFFPVGDRDEVVYQNLIANMVDRQLMLMSQINNLELLVFGSQELPDEEQRFQKKYYLWGVFRSKQEPALAVKPLNQRAVNYSLSLPPDISRDNVYQIPRDTNHATTNHFACFAESERPNNLTRPKSGPTSQTPEARLGPDRPYGSHRGRPYHHRVPPPRFRKRKDDDPDYRIKGHYARMFRNWRKESYQSGGGRFRPFRGCERYD